jgi:hypothetical protein
LGEYSRLNQTSTKESLFLYTLKQDGEGCLGFLTQRKQVKMQWSPYPSLRNVHNLNHARSVAKWDPALNVKSKCRGTFSGRAMWISMQ